MTAPAATPRPSTFPTAPERAARPTLRGSFGMTASTHWLATGAAQAMLERGGNAVDAAAAGAFVLHLVEPHLNGPGGDLVAIVAAPGGPARVVSGQGAAPAAASAAAFRAEGLTEVPGAGALAAAVPAAVEAWFALVRDRGTATLGEVLSFALHYAERGHPAGASFVRTVGTVAELFRTEWPTSAEQWLPGGEVPRIGDAIVNAPWARTLRRLIVAADGEASREAGIDAATRLWRGEVAEAIEAAAGTPHRHSTGGVHAGVLTADDMRGVTVAEEEPLTVEVRGTTVAKPGFWTQGPVTLQVLAILEALGGPGPDLDTADGVHVVAEAMKLALADRDAYYGDGAADDDARAAALARLLAPEYAAERAAQIGERASEDWRPGDVPGLTAFRAPLVTEADGAAGTGEPTVSVTGETRGDTCHIDVVDRDGMLVSATPSGGWLQSSPFIPGVGFCLGTRLQMTWLDEGSPSALVAGRRPRTTLSPTMLLRDGVPVAALGTPGGDQQDQWQLLYLIRTLYGGQTPQEAIEAPAFHTTAMVGSFWPRTWTPAGLVVEDRLGDDVIDELERRGHRVTRAGDWALGRLSVVERDPASGELLAAANPRGLQGYAAGR